MANIITGIRILCGVTVLGFPAFSVPFFALYLTAGLTDAIDGTVARKTGTASAFGAKLDTAADLVFFLACAVKLLPVLELQLWMTVWIGIIALIKAVNILSGFIVSRKFVAVHSVMNKITGVLLFLLPLTVGVIDLAYSMAAVCAIATFAAVQEGHFIRTKREK